MRGDLVTSPSPPGAGRIRDLNFPDYTIAGAGATTQIRCRNTGAFLSGQSTGGISQSGMLFFQGMDVSTLNNTGGGAGLGGSLSWLNVCNINVRTIRPAFWPLDDDWNVHRVVFIGCISVVPTSNNDTGLQFINSNTVNQGMQRTPQVGFGIQFSQTGVAMRTNNGGGVVDTVLKTNGVGGWDSTKLHAYDLRIISALSTADAVLKIIIDDVLVRTEPWTGALLPTPQANFPSFYPCLWNDSTGGGAICTKNLSFQASINELGCL